MDPSQNQKIRTFMSITGATEEVSRIKLQACNGDLNAAIDSFFSEGENFVPVVQNREPNVERMEALARYPTPSYPLPSAPFVGRGRLGQWGIPRSHSRGQPLVSHPKDVREIPIEWKDEERRSNSAGGPLIEEIPDTGVDIPSQSHAHFITDDEDPPSSDPSMIRDEGERSCSDFDSRSLESMSRNVNAIAPSVNEIPRMRNIEGGDIEQEMLRAAILASQKDATKRVFPEDRVGMNAEDDDLARAVSLSLKTAEQEKSVREGKGYSRLLEEEDSSPDDGKHRDILKRKGSTSSARGDYIGDPEVSASIPLSADNKASSSNINNISIMSEEDAEEYEEQPLLRRRSGRCFNPTLPQPSNIQSSKSREEPSNIASATTRLSESNRDAVHNDEVKFHEWGGLSSKEQVEAAMLEAAMFGGTIPENPAADGNLLGNGGYGRPIQPPSPSVIAQRLLREQQDDEYLASLEADREKDIQAQLEAERQRIKEEETKSAATETERIRGEEELCKRLAEEDLKRQKDSKRASLPEEPSMDDDTAVNLMVRMPDGNRQCRRFRKSEPLQYLFNFIDVYAGVVPGSYRLVRQYPRKAFTDAEHPSSFYDLGLNNKFETLFLELI